MVQGEDEAITYWKVKEETIDGVCENIYEVRELPKYMIVDRPEMIPYPEACSEERYFGLTKTKDVGNYIHTYYGYAVRYLRLDVTASGAGRSITMTVCCDS